MAVNKIIRISNGKEVDLTRLNEKELKRLHYIEECYIAKRLRHSRPFSEERKKIMMEGYQLVNNIMEWYLPETNKSYGVNEASIGLVLRLMKKTRAKVLYEAGVGRATACRIFARRGIKIYGCDIRIDSDVMKKCAAMKNVFVESKSLDSHIRTMTDDSIDIFYADNVLEHIMPDEIHKILESVSAKLVHGGLMVLIIPNRLAGPNDVSRFFLPFGAKPRGFHFMEMSYQETLNLFAQYGIYPCYLTLLDRKENYFIIPDQWGVLNKIKVLLERIVSGFQNEEFKRNFFYFGAYTCYVLKKK